MAHPVAQLFINEVRAAFKALGETTERRQRG
jgi:hypothetical protein